MRCLVTGGAGFIGSNLVDALLERGESVTVIDDLSTGRRENLDEALGAGAELVEGDIRDAEEVGALFERVEPQRVFHLAAQIDVRKSVADPAFDASINVGGTSTLLEAARRSGTDRFVFFSTGGAIYGEGDGKDLPLDEETLPEPMSPYGQSKHAAEGYVALYQRLYGLSAISLRLGNVYGPRQDPLGEAGVIAIFCGKIRAGENPTVFGDGGQTRDYIYVGDVVSAAIEAAQEEATGAFNVGTGAEASVLDLVDRLRALSGNGATGFEPQFAPRRAGEVERISIDPARAAQAFGWTPRTDLEEGLRKTLESI